MSAGTAPSNQLLDLLARTKDPTVAQPQSLSSGGPTILGIRSIDQDYDFSNTVRVNNTDPLVITSPGWYVAEAAVTVGAQAGNIPGNFIIGRYYGYTGGGSSPFLTSQYNSFAVLAGSGGMINLSHDQPYQAAAIAYLTQYDLLLWAFQAGPAIVNFYDNESATLSGSLPLRYAHVTASKLIPS